MLNSTANKTPTDGEAMKLRACNLRGSLCWKLETFTNGRRKRQFFTSRAKAEAALKDAQKQRKALGTAFNLLTAREKVRIMGILDEMRIAGWTLERVWKAVQAAPNVSASTCTLGDALKELLASKEEANCRPRHVKTLKWYIGAFIKGRESLDVRSVGLPEIEAWFTARNETPRSKRGHVSLLSAFFAHCWRKRYIAENPVRRLEPVNIDRKTPAILTVPQSMRAILWARQQRPKVLAWMALALFCGLRPDSEADFIAWDDIDLKQGRVVISRSKIRRTAHRIIDLSFCPPALEWLKIAKELGSALPINFQSRRRAIRALRKVLRFNRWPQDVLRHTAASNLLAHHQDAGKVAAFLGNSAGVLIRDYKALVFKEDAEKFMRLLPKARHYPKTSLQVKPSPSIIAATSAAYDKRPSISGPVRNRDNRLDDNCLSQALRNLPTLAG